MKLHFGIIGLGNISNRFASVLINSPEAELTAVASRSIEKAAAFASKYNAKRYYSSYDQLLNDSSIDIIYIGLPHNFHYSVSKQCLNHGKGVLCEKPFFLTKTEATEVVTLAKEKNLFLMEAMWTRCIPAYKKAKEWVDNNKIGKVRLINASFCFKSDFDIKNRLFNPSLAGGSLYDVGVYPIEFATGILSENPTTVDGTATFCPSGVDDLAVITLGFNSGALAALSCGISAVSQPNAYIYGENGYIFLEDFYRAKSCRLYDTEHNLIETFEYDFEDGFIFQIEHVIQLFKENKIESDAISWADTIACAEVFDKLQEKWRHKNIREA